LEQRNGARAARTLQLMVVLEPERPDLWQEAALLAHQTGDLPAAARALRRYFYLSGHVPLAMPGNDKPAPPPGESARQLWELLQEIESVQGRWN
jgi:anaerobic selenocysteine-containing dehydrogenase